MLLMRRLTLLTALVAVVALPSTAQAGCLPFTSKVFAKFNDTGLYFPAANSGFESGTTSWAVAGGAAVATGDATTYIGATSDAKALSLPAGSSATSATVCVDPSAPSMRFMLKNAGAASSKLGVDVLYTRPDGTPSRMQIAASTATTTWAPSPITYYVVNLLAFASSTGTTDVAFRFYPLDATGKWSIDDVYIDPYKRCC